MNIKSILAVIAISGAVFTQASADNQVMMGTFNAGAGGNYRFDPQGSIGVDLSNYVMGKSTDGTWYGTYCIQKNEYFSPGGIYDVAVSDRAKLGGVATNGPSSLYDIISVGTAYLYSEFAKGTLAGFTYGSSASAADLQNWFWYLENEQGATGSSTFGNQLIAQFGSIANAMLDYSGTAVKVLNLTSNQGRTLNQDQLVYVGVPDGGMTLALLGLGLLGLALAKRRV